MDQRELQQALVKLECVLQITVDEASVFWRGVATLSGQDSWADSLVSCAGRERVTLPRYRALLL